jgi:hypothetical protein
MSTEITLATMLQNVRTAKDIEKILQLAADTTGSTVIPVGRENNIGTIRMASAVIN